jgi:hypothetical protein
MIRDRSSFGGMEHLQACGTPYRGHEIVRSQSHFALLQVLLEAEARECGGD